MTQRQVKYTLSLMRSNGTFWTADNPTGSTQPNPLTLLAHYKDKSDALTFLRLH